jgi:signal transduction histidine kinase
MIQGLRKKISGLLLFFLGVMLISTLAAFNWNHYTQKLAELKSDVYRTIRVDGWKNYIETYGEEVDLGETQYCIFAVDDDKNVSIYSNHFPDMSEDKLMAYGQRLAQHWKGTEDYWGITYIYVGTKKLGHYIVLLSGAEALEASLPVMAGSVIAGILGLFMLWLASRKLSRWMVQPIEEMIEGEKLFMSNASHELKTPLTVIRANAELLSGEIGENQHLQYIQQETDRMIALVGKMLTLVRLDAPGIGQVQQTYRVDEALLDVIYPMESVAYEKKLRIQTDIMPDMQMTGDAEQMKSVMSILLDNAISYTGEGGQIRVAASLHGGKFQLSVANTGEAIPPEQRERLFERFFRQDEARGDSAEQHFGLGLSIAGRIVENWHGKIWAESKNGENIFYVTLPKSHKPY